MNIDLKSITIQLIALILIVTIIPVLILTFNANTTLSQDKNELFKEKIGDSAVIANYEFESSMDFFNEHTNKIALDPKLISGIKNTDKAGIKYLIDGYLEKNIDIDIITIVDNKGALLASSSSMKAIDPVSDKYLKDALSGKPYTSIDIIPESTLLNNGLQNIVQDTKTTDGMGFLNILPVMDENETIIGAIYSAELLNDKEMMVDEIGKHSEGYCTIFQGDTRIATNLKDDSGNRILGTKSSDIVKNNVIVNGKAYEDRLTVNGMQMYVNYVPIKNSKGDIIGMFFVGYDIGPGLSKLNDMTFTSAAIGAVIAILSAIAGFFIVNRITKPINMLVVVANEIAAGKLDTPVETGAKGGEIGELTSSIKKMVTNIKERIAFNESILKGIGTPMFVTDNDRKITYFNDACSKMTGFSKEEAMGRQCKDVFNTPLCHSEQCMLKRAWKEGDLKGAQGNITLRGGNVIDFECDATSVKDAAGHVVGGMEILRDITENKEAQKKIEKAEKDARQKAAYSEGILKSIKDNHIVIDREGRITYMNDTSQKAIGYSEKEAKGKLITDITKFKINSGRVIEALRNGTDILELEDYVLLRDGSYLPMIVNATAVKDDKGNITGLSIISRDITKEKQAQENLKAIIRAANEIADRVAKASGQVSSSTGQAMTSSRQISESIQQIAGGSQSQAQQVDEISRLIKGISTESSNIFQSSNNASKVLMSANDTGRSGGEAARIAISKMSDIQSSVNDSASIVKGLGEKSKRIGKIVEVITSIASQTNLLALNAAIEAARAGEAGRGFAVVAEEVRKLAEEAAKSTDQISDLINEIKEQTDKAVASMDKGTQEVSSGSEVVAKALKSIEDISKLIDQTAVISHGVATATEKQVRDISEVVKSIEQISAVVEESASSTEEVSASAEESTATMEEIASMAQQLSKIADELKAEVSKLKV